MAIIKYIGRTTNFKGKTLWEIIGNLKNYGIGRVVVRSVFERYSEPSFMKILKVEPQPNEDPRKVKVLVEKTFRGRKYPKPTGILRTSYKADYRLLHKDEEAEYCKITSSVPERVIPSQIEFPPIFKKIILREYANKGMEVNEDIKMPIKVRTGVNRAYKFVDMPTEVLPIGLGKVASPVLFENITPKSN